DVEGDAAADPVRSDLGREVGGAAVGRGRGRDRADAGRSLVDLQRCAIRRVTTGIVAVARAEDRLDAVLGRARVQAVAVVADGGDPGRGVVAGGDRRRRA